ncbi:MAG: hypothetical protein IJW72_03415 [Alphaproteobacteria bacterium]|nr:hypothetical protein [Alphaproteobacteria bacterium]
MLSKLFKGELPLAATFWKFGVLGLIIIKLAVKLFEKLLSGYIPTGSIYNFFMYHFHPIYSSKMSIFWTLWYLSSLLILAAYSWNITFGVWRSANNYDKSIWLSFLAKVGILSLLFIIWSSIIITATRFLGF